MLLANSAEGGTATTAVTTANSGGASGSAWDAVNAGGSGSITFDATHVHTGGLAYKIVSDAANNIIMTWDTSLGGSQTELWGRCYIYLTEVPANNIALVWLRTAANGNMGRVRIAGGTGVIDVTDASNTVVQAGTVQAAVGQWVRIEWHAIAHATAGTLTATLYNSADSTTASETVGASGTVALGAAGIDRVHYGRVAAATPPTFWLDDLGVGNSGALGPSEIAGTGTITATAALSGSGSKAVAGTGAITATASLSGAGSKAVAGTGSITATAALSGAGTSPALTAPEIPVFLPGVPVGDVPAEFNTKIRDVFHGLLAPACFRARNTGGQTLTENTVQAVEWDQIDEDPFEGWDSDNPTRFVVPDGWYGWWWATAAVSLSGTGASGLVLIPSIAVNEGQVNIGVIWEGQEAFVPTGSGQAKTVASSWWVYAAPGDVIELLLYYSDESGITAVDTTPGLECRLELHWDGV